LTDKESLWWDHWNKTYRSGDFDGNSVPDRLAARLLKELSDLRLTNPRVAEIGCGTGWFAKKLEGQCRYLGLDLSPEAIEQAKQRLPSATFLNADFLNEYQLDDRFDVVFLVDTIAYFRKQAEAVSKIHTMLEPGGHVILSSVNPFVYSRMSNIGPPGEGQVRKWLTRSQLRSLFEEKGFRVIKSYAAIPAGDRGILRFVNARKINRPVHLLIPEARLRKLKELCGLGQYHVVLARRAD
jgi:SAM-dependent methyltransferase